MSLSLYMDEHVSRAITNGLRLREVDVVTAQEDGFSGAPDSLILDRATELRRALFTQDDDFLIEAKRRQVEGTTFAGIIFVHQLSATLRECVLDLELVAKATRYEDLLSGVMHLPL